MIRERPVAEVPAIVLRHVARYPQMQLTDVYKLLHQSCLGNEHAVTDSDHARTRLEREIEQLSGGPEEPLVDPISADGRIVRVHLRPFAREDGDVDALVGELVNAFVNTASEFEGSVWELRRALHALAGAAESSLLPFSAEAAASLITDMAAAGFPALHHSDDYRAAYRPAYRVVAAVCLPPSWRRADRS